MASSEPIVECNLTKEEGRERLKQYSGGDVYESYELREQLDTDEVPNIANPFNKKG